MPRRSRPISAIANTGMTRSSVRWRTPDSASPRAASSASTAARQVSLRGPRMRRCCFSKGENAPPGLFRGNAPDRVVAVFADQDRAVAVDSNPDRPAPHFGVGDDEAGQEILIFAGRLAVLQDDTDDFAARARRPVP